MAKATPNIAPFLSHPDASDWVEEAVADPQSLLTRFGELEARIALDAYHERNDVLELADINALLDDMAPDIQSRLNDTPLFGLPISVKDLYGVQGYETCAGSAQPLPKQFCKTAALIRAFKKKGAIVVGKTHTVEFAFGGIGTNPHYPTPANPWAKTTWGPEARAPGGSSSGAAASVIEGSAMCGLGTDTAGSCRIPASWMGLCGYKSTAPNVWPHAAENWPWSTRGIVPLSTTLDSAGMLTPTVRDAAYIFGALTHTKVEVASGSITLGVARGPFYEEASPGVISCFELALNKLASQLTIRESNITHATDAMAMLRLGGPVSKELHTFLTSQLPDWFDALDPNVRQRIGDAGTMDEKEYRRRLDLLTTWRKHTHEDFSDVDVIVTPTVANTPPLLSELQDSKIYRQQNLLCLRNTSVANYLSLCALTLPIGLDAAGMPVGLQLLAPAGNDRALLQIALKLEQHLGTAKEQFAT